MSTQTKRNTYQRGMTLVEVMIAMVLGLLLTAGILQLFVSNKQTYRTTESIARLQENGRFAIFFLTNDIRAADFWGCRGQTISIDNHLNASADFDTFRTAIEAIDNDTAVDNVINGTDTITLKGTSGLGVALTSLPNEAAASFKVTDNSQLKENDIVLLSDCSDGDLLQITNDPGAGGNAGFDNVIHATGGTHTPGNLNKVLRSNYDGTDARVYKLNISTYSIQQGTNGRNSLFKQTNGATPQELVEDIENMQILYGEDITADGIPNFYKTSNLVNMNNVVAVRISLVAVTAVDNINSQSSNHSISGNVDNRIRRTFTSTIVIRNRVP